MNLNPSESGSNGNSSNPRPGQNPFPQSNAIIRQQSTREPRGYSSSYSNNFDRASARFSTGRVEANSRDTSSSAYPTPLRLPAPRKQEQKVEWNESIYGMYGDVKTPREKAPPPRRNQSQRRAAQQPSAEEEDSADEEVPRQPDPQPQRFRRQQSTSASGQQRRFNSRRDPRSDERNEPRAEQQSRPRREDNSSRGYERVNINIDTGTGTRSWSRDTETDPHRHTNINFGGTAFGDGGFPFGGRNNNGGGRLPVNMPFNLPINLPFGL